MPRYLCERCGRGFSLQTFSCTYYRKRPELLLPIARGLQAGSAHRQIARSLGCAPSTVTRTAAWLGRHALLFQALALEEIGKIDERIVFDDFETFVFSQDDRLAIVTPVGADSWFNYVFAGASHRRAGKRSSRKKAVQGPLSETVSGSYVKSTRIVVRTLKAKANGVLSLISDKHPAYPVAIEAERRDGDVRILHATYANPLRGPEGDPEEVRARDNAMFAVDLHHKLLRHSQAHHKRETIAFGRRANAILERFALFMVWRNFIKKISERKSDPVTPAMKLGLLKEPLTWKRVLAQRLFPGRIQVPEGWMRIYRRLWITPAVGRNLPHDLVHAF